jgi:hypothetical protein
VFFFFNIYLFFPSINTFTNKSVVNWMTCFHISKYNRSCSIYISEVSIHLDSIDVEHLIFEGVKEFHIAQM